MLLAYDYPLLGVFWSLVGFALVVGWLFVLFQVIGDIFRNREIHGAAKAAWLALIFFLPIIGVCAYMVINGGGIGDYRDRQDRISARDQAYARARGA